MSEVLSQAEIDALLSAISTGDLDASTIQEESEAAQVRPFDFERPSKFNKDQLRTLEMLHETFCRVVQTTLAAQLRTLVEITVTSADQVSYGEFVRSMPFPTLINVLSMSPLKGNALMEMNLPLALSVIDRMVGGPGAYRGKMRELTEIEVALTRNLIETLLRGLREAWSQVAEIDFHDEHVEMNPQFAQVAAPGDMAVLISFEMKIGTVTGMVNLCIPHLVLEPVLGGLNAQSYYSREAESSGPGMRESLVHSLSSASVPVSVALGGTTLSVADLMALTPGDVIPLDRTPGQDVHVRVGELDAFLAQPGTRGRRLAVQITRPLDEYPQGVPA